MECLACESNVEEGLASPLWSWIVPSRSYARVSRDLGKNNLFEEIRIEETLVLRTDMRCRVCGSGRGVLCRDALFFAHDGSKKKILGVVVVCAGYLRDKRLAGIMSTQHRLVILFDYEKFVKL
jgi:hypothetical protein